MKIPTGLSILLWSAVSLAQTQWVTAVIDGQTVSWVWSVTPTPTITSTSAASISTSPTTPPTTITATQTLVLLPDVTGASSILASTSLSSSIATPSSITSSPSITGSSSMVTTPSPSTSLASTSSSSLQSSSISSSTADPTSSEAAIILTQATALPSSTASTDTTGATSPTARTSNNNTILKIILGVVLSILTLLVLAILLFLCLRRRRRHRAAAVTPSEQEKTWAGNTEYMPHSQPTLPLLHATHPSNSQLYMPAPAAAKSASRNYSSDGLTPIEPDVAIQNPFLASRERLDVFRMPESARGSYQPLNTRFPPANAQHPYYDPTMTELPAVKTSSDHRPMPISALVNHQNSNVSNNYLRDDSQTFGNDHGDLGLIAHNGLYRDEPAASTSDQHRDRHSHYPQMSERLLYATRPPSVITDYSRPYLPRKSSQRPPQSYQASPPQNFDFGFGRPNLSSAPPVTAYHKSPAASVREYEDEQEQTPMITPPSHDDEEDEERDAFEDEADMGGMVPLGFSPRSPPVSGGSGLVRGSLGLSERLGSLRRSGSVRRSSMGSVKRFSIPRRPIGGGT